MTLKVKRTNTRDKITSHLQSRFGDHVRLQAAAPTPGLKCALKVKTLDESIEGYYSKKKTHKHTCKSQRRLLTSKLGSSIRNLFRGKVEGSVSGEETVEVTAEFEVSHNTVCDCHATGSVRFGTLERRLYPVAPSDNPACSGKGPAIALDGWVYEVEPAQSVEDYESTRAPRKKQEDLKMTMMDRCDRLKEHGASQKEMLVFAKRVAKAKALRAETVEAFRLYGKRHLERLEKRENFLRSMERLFRLRQREHIEQARLWEKAQQHAQSSGQAFVFAA